MKNRIRTISAAVVMLGLVAMTLSCSSAVPTDTPGIDEVGRYLLRQKGPELWTVLGFKYASQSIGQDWLILEVSFTTPPKATAKVDRDDVWVKAPDGTKIPVSTQTLFSEDYGRLRSTITQANVVRDPMDYWPPSREACAVRFFVPPGAGVAYDTVSLNDRRACEGKLFFKVPGGIDPGRWTFGVDLEESTVRIPFNL